MKACATASGGVMFIADKVNKKKCNASNDNITESSEEQQQ